MTSRTYTAIILILVTSSVKPEDDAPGPEMRSFAPSMDHLHLMRSGEHKDTEYTKNSTTPITPTDYHTMTESYTDMQEMDYHTIVYDGTITIVKSTMTTTESTIHTAEEEVYKTRMENIQEINNITTAYSENTTNREETSTSLPKTTEISTETKSSTVGGIASTVQRNPKTELTDQKRSMKPIFDSTKPPQQPKTSKNAILRSWIEDTWLRSPVGLLVPLRPISLQRALAVWDDLTKQGLNVSDIIVIGYDSNGITWRSRHSIQSSNAGTMTVSEALSKLLAKYQDVPMSEAKGDGTMKALTAAAKLVPYDSALFVVTDRPAMDSQKLPLALKALIEKRLKVFTIWTDPTTRSAPAADRLALADLDKISKHTEGEVLPYSLQVADIGPTPPSSPRMREWTPDKQGRSARIADDSERLETLLVRRGGGDASSLGIPVESGIQLLRVLIEGAVEHAVLYPPNDGLQIDLYNDTSIKDFSPLSAVYSVTPRDVILIFPGASLEDETLTVLPVAPAASSAVRETRAPTTGAWHLSVRCDTCDYRLTVRARARVGLDATLLPGNGGKEMLNLRVHGPVATVRETTLVDEHGTELAKLPFSHEPAAGEPRTLDPNTGDDLDPPPIMADLKLPRVEGKVYVKITGRDLKGDSFVRLSGPLRQQKNERTGRAAVSFPQQYNELDNAQRNRLALNGYNDSNVLPNNRATSQITSQSGSLLTAVQIGLSTRIYGSPGDNLQLHFEVSNYRERSINFRFEAVGELRFLRGLSPTTQWIGSGQTVNVIVSVGITSSAQPGARDLITFTALGLEQVSISTYVYVINENTIVNDISAPWLSHDFQGTCIGRQGDDCASHAWSATVYARDEPGGLLRLSSTPLGLLYQSNFIAGTRTQVSAIYRATCCAPRAMINAVDAYGNTNSYVLDISNYYTGAAIAAISLGVILIIALIIIVVVLIVWCVRKRKESRELPYSTSRREIS